MLLIKLCHAMNCKKNSNFRNVKMYILESVSTGLTFANQTARSIQVGRPFGKSLPHASTGFLLQRGPKLVLISFQESCPREVARKPQRGESSLSSQGEEARSSNCAGHYADLLFASQRFTALISNWWMFDACF